MHAGFFLGLHFNPDGEDNIFLRNTDWLSTNYMVFTPEDKTLHNLLTAHQNTEPLCSFLQNVYKQLTEIM
jgi:hypothetical protein